MTLTPPTAEDPRWQQVLQRDRAADGQFWYAVSTTGIYCRPSCPSRHAKPEHVRLFDKVENARDAGYRPCKRCKPDDAPLWQRQLALIEQACRRIEEAETPPPLDSLAQEAGLSAWHFHRLFKEITGLTPRAYGRAGRAERLRSRLQSGRNVTEAMYDAGYQSSGRFYAEAESVLGMPARQYREGGKRSSIHFALAECSLGSVLVAQSPLGLCAISLGDDPALLLEELQARFPHAELIGADPGFESTVARVIGFIERPSLGLDLPLDIRGTAFQQQVWQALRRIPPGETISYAELARRIGKPAAVRAVGSACGANALAVVIPCHRVVRTDGDLSGYRWGLPRKRELLLRESAQKEENTP